MQNRFEFSESQNGLIKDLAKKMTIVGVVEIVLAVIILLAAVVGLLGSFGAANAAQAGNKMSTAVGSAIQGVLFLLIGMWTYRAGHSFNLIVKTQSDNLEDLMGALGQLRNLYSLQYYLLLITLVFLVAAFVLAIAAVIIGLGR